jgi:hypothetical protein
MDGEAGQGTHGDDLEAPELCELPGLADGEGAVGVELGLVYEAGVGGAWGGVSRDGVGWVHGRERMM